MPLMGPCINLRHKGEAHSQKAYNRGAMLSTVFFIILLALSVLIMIKRPLGRLLQLPAAWEVGIATLGVLAFVFHFSIAYVIPYMEFEEQVNAPCGQKTPQGQCYEVPRELCLQVWTQYESLCKVELADTLKKLGPSGMQGPVIQKCQGQKFDKVMKFNRKNSFTFYCSSYFQFLEK